MGIAFKHSFAEGVFQKKLLKRILRVTVFFWCIKQMRCMVSVYC